MSKYPFVSIVIATLNAEKVLKACLDSIEMQKYPSDKVEIVVGDGGSTDDTLAICKRYNAKVFYNVLKTAESGKAVALKHAKGDIIALIDSDNILPDENWLKRMVAPFEDKQIIASEPLEYTYRKSDPCLTRYFALLGMNDPICLWIGNYDRKGFLTKHWTGLKFKEADKGDYLKVQLDHLPIPTMGANGFFIRKKMLKSIHIGNYLFDVDILVDLVNKNGSLYVAKVKTGIVHTFVEDSPTKFFKKQFRRINDMMYHSKNKSREIDWEGSFLNRILWFQLNCLFVFPVFFQMIYGYFRKPDWIWIFHPVAVYSTWIIYLYGWVKGKFKPQESSRDNWKQ